MLVVVVAALGNESGFPPRYTAHSRQERSKGQKTRGLPFCNRRREGRFRSTLSSSSPRRRQSGPFRVFGSGWPLGGVSSGLAPYCARAPVGGICGHTPSTFPSHPHCSFCRLCGAQSVARPAFLLGLVAGGSLRQPRAGAKGKKRIVACIPHCQPHPACPSDFNPLLCQDF